MLERIPGRLQQQAMLRIDRDGLPLGHAEEVGVEAADVVEEGSPARDRPTGHTGFGVVVQVRVPSVGGNLADEVLASQQRLPQTLRGIDSSGKSAGHADDGHGRDGCLTQCAFSLYLVHLVSGSSTAARRAQGPDASATAAPPRMRSLDASLRSGSLATQADRGVFLRQRQYPRAKTPLRVVICAIVARRHGAPINPSPALAIPKTGVASPPSGSPRPRQAAGCEVELLARRRFPASALPATRWLRADGLPPWCSPRLRACRRARRRGSEIAAV